MAKYTCRECGNTFHKVIADGKIFFHVCDSCKRAKDNAKLQKQQLDVQNQLLKKQQEASLKTQQTQQAQLELSNSQKRLIEKELKIKEEERRYKEILFEEEMKSREQKIQNEKERKILDKIERQLFKMSEDYENHFLVGFLKEDDEELNNFIDKRENKFIDIKEFLSNSIKYEKIDFMGWKKSKVNENISKFNKKDKLFYFYNKSGIQNLEIDSYIFIENDKIDEFEDIIIDMFEIIKEKEEKIKKLEELEKNRKKERYYNILNIKSDEIKNLHNEIVKNQNRVMILLVTLILGIIGFLATIINDNDGAVIAFFFLVSLVSFMGFAVIPDDNEMQLQLSEMQEALDNFIKDNNGVNK